VSIFAKRALLGSRCGLQRAKLGGGQRHFLRSRRSACARWHLRGVGVSALARESALTRVEPIGLLCEGLSKDE
jgi:hypothetical protein